MTHPAQRQLGRRTVALTDEFMLKGLFPFFATFIEALGLRPSDPDGSGPVTAQTRH